MEGLQALLLGKRNPECDACHSSCDDVYPKVLHDIARNLSDLIENTTIGRTHESQCSHPSVRTVNVNTTSLAVVADDEAREEQTCDDGCEVRKPDAVEDGVEHVDARERDKKYLSINDKKHFNFFKHNKIHLKLFVYYIKLH